MFNENIARQNPFMNGAQDGMIDIDNNSGNIDIDFAQAQTQTQNFAMGQAPMASVSQPIIEPMQERVVNRTIEHQVPHICPIRTRIINHHVFRHTYQPSYSCCEENVCQNVQCGSCCGFNNNNSCGGF